MTQLNLSGRPSNNPQQKPAAEPEGGSIKNQTVGALGALAMFAAVIVIGSCSQQQARSGAATRSTCGTGLSSGRQPPAPVPAPVQAKAKPGSTGRQLSPTSTGSTDFLSISRETIG